MNNPTKFCNLRICLNVFIRNTCIQTYIYIETYEYDYIDILFKNYQDNHFLILFIPNLIKHIN